MLKAIRQQGGPSYVPFLELFADPEVMATLLDAPVLPWGGYSRDRNIQAEFVDQAISF